MRERSDHLWKCVAHAIVGERTKNSHSGGLARLNRDARVGFAGFNRAFRADRKPFAKYRVSRGAARDNDGNSGAMPNLAEPLRKGRRERFDDGRAGVGGREIRGGVDRLQGLVACSE